MDIRQLTYVLIVAECGSILKASELLHISQPALTLAIKKVEKELGFPLFHRTPRGVHLTEMGKVFCQHVKPVKDKWDTMMHQLRLKFAMPMRHISI